MTDEPATGQSNDVPAVPEPLPGADSRPALEQLLADRLESGWELYKVEHLSDDEELVFLRRPDAAPIDTR